MTAGLEAREQRSSLGADVAIVELLDVMQRHGFVGGQVDTTLVGLGDAIDRTRLGHELGIGELQNMSGLVESQLVKVAARMPFVALGIVDGGDQPRPAIALTHPTVEDATATFDVLGPSFDARAAAENASWASGLGIGDVTLDGRVVVLRFDEVNELLRFDDVSRTFSVFEAFVAVSIVLQQLG